MTPPRRIEARLESDPELGLGRGLGASHRGDPSALQTLSTALQVFVAKGDVRCAALAAGASLITSQIVGNYRRFPEHIATLAVVRDRDFQWRSGDEELIALAGMLAGLIFFGQDDPFLPVCVERIMALLELDLDVNVKFAAGRLVMYYTEPRELRALGQRVYSQLRPSLERPELTPHRLGHWLVYWSRVARYANEPAQAQAAESHARRLAEEHKLRDVTFWLAVIDVDRSLPDNNVAEAEAALANAELSADPARLGDLLRLEFLKTKLARMKGQGGRAVFHASRATMYAIELGCPPVMHAVYIVNEAQARLLVEDFAGALELLRQAADMVPAHYVDEVRDMIALTEAYEAMVNGNPGGLALLANAWGSIRARQSYDAFDGFPEFGAKLCVLALENRIEVDFVCTLVEARNIAPPENAPETWPWAVRIHTLGGFLLIRGGESPASETRTQKKPQRKPIELLKVLIALGGRGVPKQKLSELIWGNAESADATSALDVLILRLRKLLKNPEAIRIEEGNVGLDPRLVWVDVWAFDRDVASLQTAIQENADSGTIDRISQSLMARYRGPFLANEDPQRWSLAARDRWQNRFRRSLTDVGRYWEQHNDWLRAIAVYERALEEDNLAEDLYRRLMRGYIARREFAEAARVFRRCRDMLSVQLSIPPSADTEALFKSIYAG